MLQTSMLQIVGKKKAARGVFTIGVVDFGFRLNYLTKRDFISSQIIYMCVYNLTPSLSKRNRLRE